MNSWTYAEKSLLVGLVGRPTTDKGGKNPMKSTLSVLSVLSLLRRAVGGDKPPPFRSSRSEN